MAAWVATFVGVAFLVVPQLYAAAGIDLRQLGPEGRAEFTLVCQAAETAATLALFWLLTLKFRDQLEERQLFKCVELDLFIIL